MQWRTASLWNMCFILGEINTHAHPDQEVQLNTFSRGDDPRKQALSARPNENSNESFVNLACILCGEAIQT